MDPIRHIRLRWLHGPRGDVSYEVTRHFSQFLPGKWRPAINAFRCETELKICVELAGVEKSEIDLMVEPRRVVIRGTREVAEPPCGEGCATQVIALEIDYGPFEREVLLPTDVDVEQSSAEQQNGLLWIHLPLKQ
jgi:HSP20 family protein